MAPTAEAGKPHFPPRGYIAIDSGTKSTEASHLQSWGFFSFIKSSPLVLSSLSRSSSMFMSIVENIYIGALPCICRRLKKQSYNPSHTQGSSGQEVQIMEKIESNNQGQHWDCNSLKTWERQALPGGWDPCQPLHRWPLSIGKVFVRIFQIIPCFLLSSYLYFQVNS